MSLRVAFAIATECQGRKVCAWLVYGISKAENCLAGGRKNTDCRSFAFLIAVTAAFCLDSTGSGTAISHFSHALSSLRNLVKISHPSKTARVVVFFFTLDFWQWEQERMKMDMGEGAGGRIKRPVTCCTTWLVPFLSPAPQHYIAFQRLGICSLHCQRSRKCSGGKEWSNMP